MILDFKARTWTTKDRRRIHIQEMTDKHLANAIAFLKRKLEENVGLVDLEKRRKRTPQALSVQEQIGRSILYLEIQIAFLEEETARRWRVLQEVIP